VTNHDGPAGSLDALVLSPGALDAVVRAVISALAAYRRAEEGGDLTARQFGERLGLSHETVRQLAIAGVLPHTAERRGTKTVRRFPRAYADAFVASGVDLAELAEFTARWQATTADGQDPPAPTAIGGAV
jgi:hypothetical protein